MAMLAVTPIVEAPVEEYSHEEEEDCYFEGDCLSPIASITPSATIESVLNTETMRMSHAAKNDAERAERTACRDARHTGRDDRATSEQVMDPRTRLILFKLLSHGFFERIDGCVSTGKEANVYFARRGQEAGDEDFSFDLAVKVYKTSILVFRDRIRYVDGEHRFRRGYSRGKNPRKMVKLWAEKELRNYKRLASCGVRAPRPVLLKGNVLVMEFVGCDGWPAPRLKDANLSGSKLRAAYWQTLRAMRVMFKRCRLVHGDLSEYNLLWHNSEVVVIDVSQSVEMDHPRALDFLRVDCKNINDFFSDRGRSTELEPMSTRDLFNFVTNDIDDFETDAAVDESIERALAAHVRRRAADDSDGGQSLQDDAVFMSTYLPRSLYDLGGGFSCEREQTELESGHREEAYERAVASLLKSDVDTTTSEILGSESDESDDAESDGVCFGSEQVEHGDNSVEEDSARVCAYGRLPTDPAQRALAKQHKREASKAAKVARAEKRKTKLKKHVKQRTVKTTKRS